MGAAGGIVTISNLANAPWANAGGAVAGQESEAEAKGFSSTRIAEVGPVEEAAPVLAGPPSAAATAAAATPATAGESRPAAGSTSSTSSTAEESAPGNDEEEEAAGASGAGYFSSSVRLRLLLPLLPLPPLLLALPLTSSTAWKWSPDWMRSV